MAARPLDLTWRLIQYDDPEKDLQISDADVLDGKVEMKSDSQVQVSKFIFDQEIR